jgi:hypothetical protein
MKTLGPKATLRQHEQDLLYSGARCKADPDERVQKIGDEFLQQQQVIQEVRIHFEGTEDGMLIAEALVSRRDATRDTTLIGLGAFSDSLRAGDRQRLFDLPPSQMAQLGFAEESRKIDEVSARLSQYPADHPLRLAYEVRLQEENQGFKEAAATKEAAHQRLVAARFAVINTKLDNDRFRDQQFAKLITVLGRQQADDMFRKWGKKLSKSTDETASAAITEDAEA